MLFFILLSLFTVFNGRFGYNLLDYSKFIIIAYTSLKSIFGFIFLLKELVRKNKSIHGKKYLLCLLPFAVMLFPCAYLWYLIIGYIFDYGFIELVPIILFLLFQIILLIGLLMWLVYWTFYNSKIRTWKIVLTDILSPVYLTFFIASVLHYGP